MEDKNWDEDRLSQDYLVPQVEEHQNLEYKRAAALSNMNEKVEQLTKDVSAFANADGGILIYGIAESGNPAKPTGFDPIDATVYTKEWLTQRILLIQPPPDAPIFSVDVEEPTGRVYVVDIQKGSTAHQALDKKYYRRRNNISVPMQDNEVRDTMFRGRTPVVVPSFIVKGIQTNGLAGHHSQCLELSVKNEGPVAVYHLKLVFQFPNLDEMPFPISVPGPQRSDVKTSRRDMITLGGVGGPDYSLERSGRTLQLACRSSHVLFPEDRFIFPITFCFFTSDEVVDNVQECSETHFLWRLFADDMPPKRGRVPLEDLITFGDSTIDWSRRRIS